MKMHAMVAVNGHPAEAIRRCCVCVPARNGCRAAFLIQHVLVTCSGQPSSRKSHLGRRTRLRRLCVRRPRLAVMPVQTANKKVKKRKENNGKIEKERKGTERKGNGNGKESKTTKRNRKTKKEENKCSQLMRGRHLLRLAAAVLDDPELVTQPGRSWVAAAAQLGHPVPAARPQQPVRA